MIDISFEINGRKVSPRNIGDALESSMLQSVQDSITKAVGSTRCPEHGQKPKINVKGRNLDSLKFEVSGCCDSLIEAVKKN
ncbi:MAG: hypothetical protein ABW104_09555 [Candidatus Thiodiazotropha sp. 6PLUC2]